MFTYIFKEWISWVWFVDISDRRAQIQATVRTGKNQGTWSQKNGTGPEAGIETETEGRAQKVRNIREIVLVTGTDNGTDLVGQNPRHPVAGTGLENKDPILGKNQVVPAVLNLFQNQ